MKFQFSQPMDWHTYDVGKIPNLDGDFPHIRQGLAKDLYSIADVPPGVRRRYVIPYQGDYAELSPADVKTLLFALDQTRKWLGEAYRHIEKLESQSK